MRNPLTLALLLIAGCTFSAPDSGSIPDPNLQKLSQGSGASPAGSHAVSICFSKQARIPATSKSSSNCNLDTSVLLYIRQGRAISELERHGRVVASEAPFVYFQSIDGAVSPHGFIRLSRESGRTIWIERTYGDGPPIDSMFAHVQLGPKYFAQYLYKGDTVQSHLSAAGAVEAYAAAGGIR